MWKGEGVGVGVCLDWDWDWRGLLLLVLTDEYAKESPSGRLLAGSSLKVRHKVKGRGGRWQHVERSLRQSRAAQAALFAHLQQ